jgi:type 1 glutamine amidotransferase
MRAAFVLRIHWFQLLLLAGSLAVTNCLAVENPRILIYTKNQVGQGLYVHDNIAQATAAIQKAAAEQHIDADVSADPAVFTKANLKRYKAIVFNNTNNEILETEEQKAAFQEYIRGGGGFVGIHSACGSMRNWPWFWAMLGGKFKRHPKLQPFLIHVKDREDISTRHLPAEFTWTDEFYYQDHLAEDLHVLLTGDLTKLEDPEKDKYPGKAFGDEFPLAWRHEFEGGRAWYTALGHKGEYYADPRFIQHILGGIRWAIGEK